MHLCAPNALPACLCRCTHHRPAAELAQNRTPSVTGTDTGRATTASEAVSDLSGIEPGHLTPERLEQRFKTHTTWPPPKFPARYLPFVDRCQRCPSRPNTAPSGQPSGHGGAIILSYRCRKGHCWQRTWPKEELRRTRIKIGKDRRREIRYLTGAMPRPHVELDGTPRIPYATAALADAASIDRSELTGLPSPGVYRCPTCDSWHLR